MKKKRILSDIVNKDFYRNYCATVKSPVSEKVFTRVLDAHNVEMYNLVVDGFRVYFHKGLSTFSIIEKKRYFRTMKNGEPILPVNWSLTKSRNEYDEKGFLVRQYIIEDYYYKVAWYKYYAEYAIKYKFIPCKAFRMSIFQRIKADPLIKFKYRSNVSEVRH